MKGHHFRNSIFASFGYLWNIFLPRGLKYSLFPCKSKHAKVNQNTHPLLTRCPTGGCGETWLSLSVRVAADSGFARRRAARGDGLLGAALLLLSEIPSTAAAISCSRFLVKKNITSSTICIFLYLNLNSEHTLGRMFVKFIIYLLSGEQNKIQQ